MIEDRDTVVLGTKLKATFKGKRYTCAVRAIDNGEKLINRSDDGLRFEVKGFQRPKKTLPTLSAAGRYIAHYQVNGWRFWTVVSSPEED